MAGEEEQLKEGQNESSAVADQGKENLEKVDATPGEGGAKEDQTGTTPPGEGNQQPLATDWKDKRIAKLTAKNHAHQQTIADLQRQLQAQGNGSAQNAGETTAAYNERIRLEAERLVAQREFNAACERMNDAGTKAWGGEFTEAINQIRELVDRNDQRSVAGYFALLEAAAETGNGHQVLYELGKNSELAERLMLASPTKMAVGVAKLAAGGEARGEGSAPRSGPRPMPRLAAKNVEIGAMTPDDPRSDKMSTAEWVKARYKQKGYA